MRLLLFHFNRPAQLRDNTRLKIARVLFLGKGTLGGRGEGLYEDYSIFTYQLQYMRVQATENLVSSL